MTTTSSRLNRLSTAWFLSAIILILLLGSCKKSDWPPHGAPPSSYSSEVIDKWMTMQLRLMRNATGIPNQAFSRHYAYTGITAIESIGQGLPAHSNWSSKWNGLTGLPTPDHSVKYYYPANVNAAMAAINKALFPNASAADKLAIDSLETALNQSFLTTEPASRITKSSEFGKAVAAAVYNWAETDGYNNANNPYTPPIGAGLWKPTPPAFAPAATPHWGNNRTAVINSTANTQLNAPISYSTDPSSPFFAMVKQVYDVSLTLTEDQKAMAMFWRDVPGVSSPGHWLSILQQTVRKTNAKLDKAVVAYALSGVAINDALISCWKSKYTHNLVRPVTYVREVMGQASWSSFIGTPAHPEYPSAHSALSGAGAAVIEELFGNVGTITDHTYDYLGFAPRTYPSFNAIAVEAGLSRIYGGIHFQQSVDAGLGLGIKVAVNILSKNHNSKK